jgi:hypothetical protein
MNYWIRIIVPILIHRYVDEITAVTEGAISMQHNGSYPLNRLCSSSHPCFLIGLHASLTSLCLLHGLVLAHIRCRIDRVSRVAAGGLVGVGYAQNPETTLAACCTACYADDRCVAIEYTTVNRQCNFHDSSPSCPLLNFGAAISALAVFLSPC